VNRLKGSYSVVVPFVVLLLHSLIFRGWIVDDAGISFAYARNLAEGYGLVSYPGLPPVEGISNFLWTVLMVPFFWLKVFHPVWTPKIIALIFLGGVFHLNRKIISRMAYGGTYALAINLLLAVNTPLVVWSESGMENSLFAFLLVAYCYCVIRFCQDGQKSTLISCAALVFLISITRPEGIFFAAALPLVLLAMDAPLNLKLSNLLNYSLALLLPVAAFLLFRHSYFNDWLPNTYYAKGRQNAFAVFGFHHAVEKFRYLSFAIGGRWAVFLLLFSLAMFPFLFRYSMRANAGFVVPMIFFLLSFFHFMLLPDDWMHELRFATPCIVFVFPYLLLLISFFVEKFEWYNLKIIGVAFLLFFIYSGYHFYNRSFAFAQKPTVPFEYVKRAFADTFNNYSKRLHLHNASVLLPDVGATLFYSNIEVHDAAGLCDRMIGRNIYRDTLAVRDYIFESVKPTFIHVHQTWTVRISPDDDARFRINYFPIYEYAEDSLSKVENKKIMSGNYIRKDAVNNSNAASLDSIVAEERIKGVRW
jgi:hypothetical protein